MKTGAQRVYSMASESRGYPWEQPAAFPPVCCGEAESDVVVIGGGIAGLAAAARCSQRGYSVTVLEQAAEAEVSADDLVSALDSRYTKADGITADPAVFVREWESFCGGRASEELLWLFARRSGEAMDWLAELLGADGEVLLSRTGYRGTDVSNYGCDHLLRSKSGSNLPEHGGALICELLKRELRRCGGSVRYGVRALMLRQAEDGAVTGVAAVTEGGAVKFFPAKRTVVLAAGDILGSDAWMEAFCSTGKKVRAGAVGGRGRAHTLAYQAGASFEWPQWAMATRNTAYTPLTLPTLYVNQQGRRFMNEDTWDQAKEVRCRMQPGGDFAWAVFDANYPLDLAKLYEISGLSTPLSNAVNWGEAKPLLEQALETALENGNAVKADSLAELAAQMGIPADKLEATVARYNAHAAAGADRDFGKRAELLTAVARPPFYAAKWGPELTGVYGGIRVDGAMRVLRADGTPIPGLRASGSATAGLFSLQMPPFMDGAGNGQALTWALLLADGMEQEG